MWWAKRTKELARNHKHIAHGRWLGRSAVKAWRRGGCSEFCREGPDGGGRNRQRCLGRQFRSSCSRREKFASELWCVSYGAPRGNSRLVQNQMIMGVAPPQTVGGHLLSLYSKLGTYDRLSVATCASHLEQHSAPNGLRLAHPTDTLLNQVRDEVTKRHASPRTGRGPAAGR